MNDPILQLMGNIAIVIGAIGGLIGVITYSFRNAAKVQDKIQAKLLKRIEEIEKDNDALRLESEERHRETLAELKESRRELENARMELARAEGIIQAAYKLNRESIDKLEIANQTIGGKDQLIVALTQTNVRLEDEKKALVEKINKMQEELNEERESKETMALSLSEKMKEKDRLIETLKLTVQSLEQQMQQPDG